MTGTWPETLFTNTSDYNALASSAAEGSLLTLTSLNKQPVIPADYFNGNGAPGRAIKVLARGIFSNTGTPTLIFQARLGTTILSTNLSGSSVGVSAAITTTSGVTNVWWQLELDLICTVVGQGTANCTLSGSGPVMSPAGFASPFCYPMEPTTPNTATWTATLDGTLKQALNLSATWSASSASNSIQCKSLIVTSYFA